MRSFEQPTFEQYVTAADWASCAAWSAADCRAVMLNTPQDASTFHARTERTRQQTITELTDWWHRHDGEDGAGFAGLFLLTLIALDYSETRRSNRGPLPVRPHDEDTCQRLVDDPAVRAALLQVYTTAEEDTAEAKVWRRIRPESLRFHRHGTTSFILQARLTDPDLGIDQECAVKCLIYPFLRIPTIARATREYAARYRRRTAGREHLVHVLASSDGWVLMDFVHGRTLDEELEQRTEQSSGNDPDLDLVEEFGSALFSALADLEASGLHHHDLTPSNIIVTRDSTERTRLRLVDLGANYLYVQNMPGQNGKDVRFVAPEVRGGAFAPGFRSDLFSLGQLVLLIGSGALNEDDRVPPTWYARAPQLARFVEDLIDEKPEHRLLVFSGRADGTEQEPLSDASGPPDHPTRRSETSEASEQSGRGQRTLTGPVGYRQLWDELRAEIDDVRLARTDRLAGHSTLGGDLKRTLLPLDGAPRRLWRLWRGSRVAGESRRRGAYRRRLLSWSLLSVLSCAVLTALVLLWTYRALGLDWDNQVIVLLQRLTGASSDEFPIVDELRAPDYALPPGTPSALFGLLAFSFALVGVRYYQSLLADLTPLRIGRAGGALFVRALAVEVLARFWTVAPLLLVLPPLLIQPRWWASFAAGGMVVVALTNWLTSSYGQAVTRAAQHDSDRLSTVPRSIPGVARYATWIPGNVGYAVWVTGIALMLATGWAQDHLVYMAMVTAINLFQLYGVKCGREGPGIRAGLVQACIAAERLRVLRELRTPGTGEPTEPAAPSELVPADSARQA